MEKEKSKTEFFSIKIRDDKEGKEDKKKEKSKEEQ